MKEIAPINTSYFKVDQDGKMVSCSALQGQ